VRVLAPERLMRSICGLLYEFIHRYTGAVLKI
jgi:hypothetical protein